MWNIVQCAVQGKGHIKTDIPCQDKTFSLRSNDVEIIALADGAGSASLSHFGAELVTKKICEFLSQKFELFFYNSDGATVKREIIDYLISELENLSRILNCTLKELNSTLLAVAIHDGKYIIIHVGDGVIGYTRNDELKIATYPNNGEFVNTTVFLTSKEAIQTMSLMKGELNDIDGFALMSDGTETKFYDKKERCLAPALKKLMNLSRVMKIDCLQKEIEKFFNLVLRESTSDDCSLIFAAQEDPLFRGYNYLSTNQKKDLFQLRNRLHCKRQIKRYDEILKFAQEPKSIYQISKKIKLKQKYCRKYIEKLFERNLIIQDEKGHFCTAIVMEK